MDGDENAFRWIALALAGFVGYNEVAAFAVRAENISPRILQPRPTILKKQIRYAKPQISSRLKLD